MCGIFSQTFYAIRFSVYFHLDCGRFFLFRASPSVLVHGLSVAKVYETFFKFQIHSSVHNMSTVYQTGGFVYSSRVWYWNCIFSVSGGWARMQIKESMIYTYQQKRRNKAGFTLMINIYVFHTYFVLSSVCLFNAAVRSTDDR